MTGSDHPGVDWVPPEVRCAIKLYRYLRDECGLTLEETDFTLSWHHHQRDIGVSALSDESPSHSHTTTKTSGTRPVGRIPVCFFSDTDATRAPRFNYHCPNMGMFALSCVRGTPCLKIESPRLPSEVLSAHWRSPGEYLTLSQQHLYLPFSVPRNGSNEVQGESGVDYGEETTWQDRTHEQYSHIGRCGPLGGYGG